MKPGTVLSCGLMASRTIAFCKYPPGHAVCRRGVPCRSAVQRSGFCLVRARNRRYAGAGIKWLTKRFVLFYHYKRPDGGAAA